MKERKVAIFTLYKDDKFLLQHRDSDTKRFPNRWGFFGGGIEEGETPEEAVVRECKEELNYDLKDFEFDGEYEGTNFANDLSIHAYFFIAPLLCDFEDLELHEGQGMKMVKSSEIESLQLLDIEKQIIKDIDKKLNPK